MLDKFLLIADKLIGVATSHPTGYIFFAGAVLFFVGGWMSGRRRTAIIFLLLPVVWVVFHNPLRQWLGSIGADSLSEAQSFAWNEAFFFAKTLAGIFVSGISVRFSVAYAVLGFLLALVALGAILLIRRARPNTNVSVLLRRLALVMMILPVAGLAISLVSQFKSNADIYSGIIANYSVEAPEIQFFNKELTVVVYIGESTSSMHMGLYGYPRNTTPLLSKIAAADLGFLSFGKVLATHTHTSPSLLEALSLPMTAEEVVRPIYERKRLPVVNALIDNGIPTYLFSNQGQVGTWNYASSVIFQRSENTFSTAFKASGNLEHYMEKPFDDVFFDAHLDSFLAEKQSPRRVAFLHSYAGHGDYLKFIPSRFHSPVDASLKSRKAPGVFGDGVNGLATLEAYDSAVTYIDYSVSKVIERLSRHATPAIFIFFSDHGESVFTGAGHDSSRMAHEMLRVPFIMYFNEAARAAYPEKYRKYKALAQQDYVSTLAQTSPTILDLLGSNAFNSPVVGQKSEHAPVLVRETSRGTRFIDVNRVQPDDDSSSADDATRIFVATNDAPEALSSCYHRSNTLGKMLRGSMVADCLEVDVVVAESGDLLVGHPPMSDVGVRLGEVLAFARQRSDSVWIDAKNIHESKNCRVLERGLRANAPYPTRIFVEFPPRTEFDDQELVSCAQELRRLLPGGVSYYVPTASILTCSQSLDAGVADGALSESCAELDVRLRAAVDSKMFSHFSFDIRGVAAMKHLVSASELKWNTWGVDASEYRALDPSRFDMVILNARDPNNR